MLQRVDVLVFVDREPPVRLPNLVAMSGRSASAPAVTSSTSSKSMTPRLFLMSSYADCTPGDLGAIPGECAIDLARLDGDRRTGQEVHLGPLEIPAEVAHGRDVGGQAASARGLGDEPRLGRQEVGERATAQPRPEVAQLAQGRCVEGAHLHAVDTQTAQPGAHLAGCARGEGDRQGAAGVVRPGGHAVRDAVGDGAGLPRARSGEYDDGTMERLGDGALFVVEAVEGVLRLHRSQGNVAG